MFSLPTIPAPAAHRLDETVDSYWGMNPSRIWLAAVVCTPLVQNRSFMPIGTPDSGFSVPAARSLSAWSAAASAWSGVSTMKAFSAVAAATLALNPSATSRAVKLPPRKPSRMPATVRVVRSLMLKLRHAELVSASMPQYLPDEAWTLKQVQGDDCSMETSSFNHLRHAEKAVLCRWRICQHSIPHIATGQRISIHHIIAQAQRVGDNSCHRLH